MDGSTAAKEQSNSFPFLSESDSKMILVWSHNFIWDVMLHNMPPCKQADCALHWNGFKSSGSSFLIKEMPQSASIEASWFVKKWFLRTSGQQTLPPYLREHTQMKKKGWVSLTKVSTNTSLKLNRIQSKCTYTPSQKFLNT